MPKLTWRFPILVAGLALVAIETYGSVTYLLSRDGGFSYLVLAGAACTIISGFLPWIGERAWKEGQWLAAVFAYVMFPAAVSTIVFAAIERSGSAMDRTNAAIIEQARRIEVTNGAIADARSALANATAAASAECRTGRGPRCQSLEVREQEARDALDTARSEASNVGGKKTNPLISRLVAMLPISDEKASLYEPLVLPLTLSMLSVLCVWIGLGKPRRIEQRDADTATSAATEITLRPKPGAVAPFMAERLTRAEGARIAAADLFEAYRAWCAAKDVVALDALTFGDRLKTICDTAGIRRGKGHMLINVSLTQ